MGIEIEECYCTNLISLEFPQFKQWHIDVLTSSFAYCHQFKVSDQRVILAVPSGLKLQLEGIEYPICPKL